ncbi:MAG: ROK family protein [Actinomycetota bacterium]|nr:ROK family protein [Actinomycetota bacterium]
MAQLTAGVDLGGTKIQTALLRSRTVAGSTRVPTPQTGPADVVTAIVGTIRDALKQAGAPATDLGGVGIGSPGEIDGEAGAVSNSPNLPGFRERVRLGPLVSRRLRGVPVTLDNDVRVAVLGEFRRGAGRPYRDFLGVFVGTGVGGGLILGGKLREGRGGAGEIGHTVVQDGGRRCGCGRRGCLEAYAGRGSMERTARRWQDRGHKTVLFDVMKDKGADRLTSGVIAAALKEKDRMARRLVDEAVWALGIALASAQNVLDLEAIIVGGGLGDRLGQPFVAGVAEAMYPHLFVSDRPPAVLGTELGDLSGAVGAAVRAGG